MDLDYMQKYHFSSTGGCGGLPFMVDASIMTSTLTGGSLSLDLAIPGGLVYRPCIHQIDLVEKDPWTIVVKENFDSLLDLVSLPLTSIKRNKTVKNKKG